MTTMRLNGLFSVLAKYDNREIVFRLNTAPQQDLCLLNCLVEGDRLLIQLQQESCAGSNHPKENTQ